MTILFATTILTFTGELTGKLELDVSRTIKRIEKGTYCLEKAFFAEARQGLMNGISYME